MIISIDGARPDLLLRANAPHVRAMLERGAYSFWARTTEESITLPSHASMITGVPPKMHGITWNDDIPVGRIRYSPYPTLFQAAKQAGLSTAMAAGKSKFIALATPGSIDWMSVPDAGSGDSDMGVAKAAAGFIREHKPQVMLVHLPGPDGAGHGSGWGSPKQVQVIEGSDEALGVVLDALREAGVFDQTLIIVTADHGGAGKHHGPDDPRSRHIPWICTGPGVRQGVDLTEDADLTINTEDTFTTACYFLGLPTRPDITGKPIVQAMEDPSTKAGQAAEAVSQPATAAP
jgi:predicted AlkP superfamily pyrophosphatase or phosphodiesterase